MSRKTSYSLLTGRSPDTYEWPRFLGPVDTCIIVPTNLFRFLNTPQALLLSYVHYCMDYVPDGSWVSIPMDYFRGAFCHLSDSTIRRHLRFLIGSGFLLVRTDSPEWPGHKLYRVNYDQLDLTRKRLGKAEVLDEQQ